MSKERKSFGGGTLFPDPTIFFLKKNTVILVSNSFLDGFKEGDGDLMQKLVESFHQQGYLAKRVIENDKSVPQDIEPGLLEILESKSESLDNRHLREKFLLIVNKYLSQGLKIIFYIGSRFDSVDNSTTPPVLSGSGSFFEKDLLAILKKLGVKIVICCLEYKFFKRSHYHMLVALEMHRQQLFLADRIHFLTIRDQEDFLETMRVLQTSPILEPCQELQLPGPPPLSSYDLSEEIKTISWENIGRKTHFIPGIYTLSPLEDKNILPQVELSDEKIIDFLAKRPNNVFWFGLIRAHKGIDEGLELAKIFSQQQIQSKVVICGTVMFDNIFYLVRILTYVYGLTSKQVQNEIKSILSESVGLTALPSTIAKKELSKMDLGKYEKVFDKNKINFNLFCQKVFDAIKGKYASEVGKNIEFHFNLSEPKIQQLTLRCRWAIKFDHKGMASNASSIVSCLGCYLPTFTTIGLVTDDYFISKDSSFYDGPSRWWPAPGQYSKTVIMPGEKYRLVEEKKGTEIQPIEVKLEPIIKTMQHESEEEYKGRLRQLRALKKSEFYCAPSVANKILKDVFQPLAAEQAVENEQRLKEWKASLENLGEQVSENPQPLIKYIERQQILRERLGLLNERIKHLRASTSSDSDNDVQGITSVEQEFETVQAEYEEACQMLQALIVQAIPDIVSKNTLQFN